jgi:hypothetical protein
MRYWNDEWKYTWYNLAGVVVSEAVEPSKALLNLRIDARGHVREVQLSAGVWYDLNGGYVATTSYSDVVKNLRVDARGHIRNVEMYATGWYDLNGEAA